VLAIGDTVLPQLLSLILVLPFIGCSYFIIWESVRYGQSVLSLQEKRAFLQSLQFLEALLSKYNKCGILWNCILIMDRVFVRDKAAAEQE
jgi:hypothetical protein